MKHVRTSHDSRNAVIVFLITSLLASLPCIASAHQFDVRAVIEAHAQAAGQTGRVTFVKKGEPAPYDGTLLDADAAARLVVSEQTSNERCQIEIDREVRVAEARLNLELRQANASLNAAREKLELQRQFDARRIDLLSKEIERTTKNTGRDRGQLAPLYFSGGVVLGALVTVAISFAVASGS